MISGAAGAVIGETDGGGLIALANGCGFCASWVFVDLLGLAYLGRLEAFTFFAGFFFKSYSPPQRNDKDNRV